ncbi:MAG: DUF1552 domain-containing protein [Acidimicrobiia bacterium]|nr:DUF1552 domain-containing protein [Acidimicrobiia bacterium]
MIVKKLALSRRTFLRGTGATLALPLLDSMVPALTAQRAAAAKPVRRVGFIYMANGVAMNDALNYWKPTVDGALTALSPILSPLEPFRSKTLVISGLVHAQAEPLGDGNGDHTRGTATWLNGVHPRYTEASDVQAGTTIDQIIAEAWAGETMLPSLELGIDPNFTAGSCENGYSCLYMNTLAWRWPTSPLPMENNPRVVFERLFGEGGTAAQRIARARHKKSLLDSVLEEANRLRQTLGPSDQVKVADYFDAVREVERRIQQAERHTAESPIPVLPQPLGIPDSFEEHVKLMYDLQWLAYQADITRVFTFMLGREVNSRTFPQIGVNEPHHGVSHHRDEPGQLEKLAKINTYQTQIFQSFVERLHSTPDGDGTLLDHSMLLYGAGLSNPNTHSHLDLPVSLVGGPTLVKGGRHLRAPASTPMTNLLLALADRAGVPVERLGDSTGQLNLLADV